MRERKGALSFRGLDLSTMRVHMDPGAGQSDVNGDRRRSGTWRIRAGYARLLDGADAVVAVGASPSRLFSFERDDDDVRVMVARGLGMESFTAGGAEWSG